MIIPAEVAAKAVRSAATDVSDLTKAKRSGTPAWVDGALVIPFTPEPTAAEQARIRRRLLTVDAAQEAWVGKMIAAYRALATDQSAVAVAVRLLIEDRLGALNE